MGGWEHHWDEYVVRPSALFFTFRTTDAIIVGIPPRRRGSLGVQCITSLAAGRITQQAVEKQVGDPDRSILENDQMDVKAA